MNRPQIQKRERVDYSKRDNIERLVVHWKTQCALAYRRDGFFLQRFFMVPSDGFGCYLLINESGLDKDDFVELAVEQLRKTPCRALLHVAVAWSSEEAVRRQVPPSQCADKKRILFACFEEQGQMARGWFAELGVDPPTVGDWSDETSRVAGVFTGILYAKEPS